MCLMFNCDFHVTFTDLIRCVSHEFYVFHTTEPIESLSEHRRPRICEIVVDSNITKMFLVHTWITKGLLCLSIKLPFLIQY